MIPEQLAVAEVIVGGEINAVRPAQSAVAPLVPERLQLGLPAFFERHGALVWKAGSPMARNRSASPSAEGLGAVSSLSPKKIELAPARKQRICSSRLILSRPALRRTRALGKAIRVVATRRTSSMESTGSAFSRGVPAMGTRLLIGMLSGDGSRWASSDR